MGKMMPGQEPYTAEEEKARRRLLDKAVQAVEEFGEDALELFASQGCRKCGRPFGDGRNGTVLYEGRGGDPPGPLCGDCF